MDNKNTKLALCLVISSPLAGGAQKVMLQLANAFSRDKFDISVILCNSKGNLMHLIPRDIPVFDLKMPLSSAGELFIPNLVSFLKLCSLFRKLRPAIVFSTLTGPNLLVLLARFFSCRRTRLVIRETTIVSLRLDSPVWQDKLKKIMCKILYPFADKIVAPAGIVLDDLNTFIHLKRERQVVIHNFIDPGFIDHELSRTAPLTAGHLTHDKPVVISVGRLDRVKGFDIGIQAIAEAQKDFPCDYWLLGQGAKEGALKELVSDLGLSGRVHFLGFQANPYIFLRQADIFLLPSRYEAFPNALLEAMYCGLPCVVSKYNESVEDIIQDGFNGMIIEPENPTAMAHAIKKLLSNPSSKENIGTNARIRSESFNIFRTVKQYEDLFLTSRSHLA